ncbi:MAG: Sir2 family NAD-dependent protein deacetylase [Acidobacteriota bacterium]|jgi:NAD-dependent deacetylase
MIRPLTERLEKLGPGRLVVVTGAGISAASGIPTFRGSDPDAVWKRDILELGTFGFFRRDPVASWRWYLERFRHVLEARPNPSHLAIAALERWHLGRGGEFLLVTQNIDTLHEQAGSRTMVKVHGSADRVRCATDGCVHGAPSGSLPRDEVDVGAFLEHPSTDTLPRCPACGDVLRQHVLWFDEYYAAHEDFQWPRVMEAASSMDLALFVGTSFAVGVTELFLELVRARRVPAFSVDPGGVAPRGTAVAVLRGKAEELLPEVCRRVGAPVDGAGNRPAT